MARKQDSDSRGGKDKVKAVLKLLQKDAPLSPRKRAFCDEACIRRFLKARSNSSKKAAKHLKSCLAFRDSIRIEHLIADEFSWELAEGIAYVAGRDHESRPVIIVRIKPDFQKRDNSQRLYVRLLTFTMEVAIASMPSNVEQCVLLFDAGDFKSGSACLNYIMATMKHITDYYPGRVARAFVIDPPYVFNYIWKGVRPFVDSELHFQIVCSLDYDSPFMSGLARTSSLRHDISKNNGGSFRFSAKVASAFESVHSSPHDWDRDIPTTNKNSQSYLLGSALLSPFNARCLSFASPSTTAGNKNFPSSSDHFYYDFQSFRFEPPPARKRSTTPSTPYRGSGVSASASATPLRTRTPGRDLKASSKQTSPKSPAPLDYITAWTPFHNPKSKKNSSSSPKAIEGFASFIHGLKHREGAAKSETLKKEKSADLFRPYLRHYRYFYNEAAYRATMKPPLGGLASLVSPELKQAHNHNQSSSLTRPSFDPRRTSYEFKR